VLLETCAESFAIADEALALGHDVRVIPSDKVRILGVGHHGKKTDRRDAEALSQASVMTDLKGVHIPSAQARELKAKLAARDALVSCRVLLVNTCRGILRCSRITVKASTPKSFAKKAREAFVARGLATPAELERALVCIVAVEEQIQSATFELDELSKGHKVCRILRTAPGVGPVVSVAFVATMDGVERFSGAHALESYLGLVPGEDSSSMSVRRTGITKAGSDRMRRLLVQAAWQAVLRHPRDPMVEWAKEVMLRRGKGIGIVALARKMAGILYGMWRDGTDYDPSRGAAVLSKEAPPSN
jgi:transposase